MVLRDNGSGNSSMSLSLLLTITFNDSLLRLLSDPATTRQGVDLVKAAGAKYVSRIGRLQCLHQIVLTGPGRLQPLPCNSPW